MCQVLGRNSLLDQDRLVVNATEPCLISNVLGSPTSTGCVVVNTFEEFAMALPPKRGAALYVRASTEHQNYSTDHQESALREYATQHDFEVVAVYRDEGRSGLTLDGRNGLLRLLEEVH